MTGPKITVGADVSAITNELAKVQAAAAKINKTLSSGEVGIDVKQAKSDLESLARSAATLTESLTTAKTGGKSAASDFAAAASALEDAAAAAASLEQVLEAVGQSSGLAGSVKNSKALVENLQRAARAQAELAKDGRRISQQEAEELKKRFDAWRSSGARGTSRIRNTEFDDWLAGGWRSYSINEQDSRRNRDQILHSIGAGGGSGGAGGGSGSGAGGSGRDRALRSLTRFGGIAGGVVSGVASGGGFGIGAIAGGLAGAIPGAGGVLGPIAGALGGAIDQALQRVVEQNSTLTDLRHSLGETTTDFDTLRQSVMQFTEGLGISGQEAAKLAATFAHASGTTQDSMAVGRGTGNAVGFARGYGLDPNTAVQFFGLMRHFGVSKSDTDDKRLALSIGEAVARNGMGPRMDEFMSALLGYTEQQSRSSFTQANAQGYASFMSSMTGSGLSGLHGDPQAAMSAMASADAALRQGGAFGESSKVFSLGLYQRMLGRGFNALDLGPINDQGAFGTIGRAFGAESPAMAMAKAMGDRRAMAKYSRFASGPGSDDTILSLQMRNIERFYGNTGAEGVNKAIQSQFGVNSGQAAALYTAFKSDKGLGGLQASLKAAGVDIAGLDPKRIGALAQISGMNASGLRGEAGKLLNAGVLSGSEKDRLNSALASGKEEDVRKMVLSLSALHDIKDAGEVSRDQQASLLRTIDKMADALLPDVSIIKQGIIALVQKIAPESGLNQKIEREAYNKMRAENARAAPGIDADLKSAFDQIRGGHRSPQAIASYNKALQMRNALEGVDPSALPYLDKNGKPMEMGLRMPGLKYHQGGASDQERLATRNKVLAEAKRQGLNNEQTAYLLSLVEYESVGFNPRAQGPVIQSGMHRGDRAYGPFQFMAKSSQGWDRTNTDQNIAHGVAAFKDGWRKGGRNYAIGQNLGAVKDGRFNPNAWDGHHTGAEYLGGIVDNAHRYMGPPVDWSGADNNRLSPGGAKPAAKAVGSDWGMDAKVPASLRPTKISMNDSRQVIEHRVTVLDQAGNPHYNSTTQTRIGSPVPAGMSFA